MKVKSDGNWSWLWNVMDKKTRYLLASTITSGRSMEEASTPFQEGEEDL